MPALKAPSLGSYRLLRKLGTGGMAEVFLAAQRMGGGLTRPVVIKAILPHLAEDERFEKMFMREARVAAMLTHPNIVQIYDVTKLDERPCIVMEFLKGRDLWTVLNAMGDAKRAINPHAAAAIMAQAASALDYAHRLRDREGSPVDLVHRDISPHNLFLTREGHVKVLDFGIAKSAYQKNRTESGVIKGKLPYMAPEQARGKDVDGRADQFSMGVVLWEMVTGRRLFARDDALQTMTAMFHDPTPPPSTIIPVPQVLERIIMRTLRRSPTDRFDSCESLAHALRSWLASEEAAAETRLVRRLLSDAVPVHADHDFYAPDSTGDPDATSDEMRVVGVDFTPSHGDTRPDDAFGRPPPLEITPTPPLPDPERERRKRIALSLAGALTLLLVAFVVTAWALSEPTTVALPPTASAAQPQTGPVAIQFVGVPGSVTLEVDGSTLGPDRLLRVEPSDDVHHVRALVNGRELWRYDGIFREDMQVALPTLTLPSVTGTPDQNIGRDDASEDELEDDHLEADLVADDHVEDDPRTRTMQASRMFITIMRPTPTRMTTTTMATTPRMTTPRMTTPRMTPTPTPMTLGMQIDLGYP